MMLNWKEILGDLVGVICLFLMLYGGLVFGSIY